MSKKEYIRKHKEDKPVLALCYDFDKTLSPDEMQAQGYIQSVGYDVTDDFWEKSNALAEENDMDQNLAYMYLMIHEADGRIVVNKEELRKYGSEVKMFPGVEEWFERIRSYGKDKGVIVEHYILSSGLKEMIEGTSVARAGAFEKIYASSFYYENGRSARWPAQAVNYTSKTQFLFRIEKGVLDINDPGVNDYFEPDKIRVPFRNIVYFGDSDTDIPCMKLVNSLGGHSIGVFNPETQDKTKVYKMMREKRIKYYVPADYNEGTEIDKLVKAIIDKTAANELLEAKHFECHNENVKADKENNEEERIKKELIDKLEDSISFANTHEIIKQLSECGKWTDEQKERLCEIAAENSQVFLILTDEDVRRFYKKIIKRFNSESESVLIVKKEIK